MPRLSRSTAIKIAAVISLLLGVYGFISALPYLALGANTVNQVADGPPYFVIFWSFVFALLAMLAAYGTWHNQRVSIVVALLANAGNALLAAPGILFAPTTFLQISSSIGTLLNMIVIVLCLWRDSKPIRPS